MKKLVVYGAPYPDVVKIVYAINARNPQWNLLGFVEDNPIYEGKDVLGYPILGNSSIITDLATDSNVYFFSNHYGHYEDFKARCDFLVDNNCKIASLIHPDIDLSYVKVGIGCLLAEDTYLGAYVELGDFVTIRGQSIISHHAKVSDYVMISPGCNVGSVCRVGEGAFLGAGCTILRTKNLGAACTVGCGAVVVKDVDVNSTVVGVPAQKIKKPFHKRIIKKIIREIKNYKVSFNKNESCLNNEKINCKSLSDRDDN